MQTITLKVDDEAVDKVLELLSRLPNDEVKVITSTPINSSTSDNMIPIDELAGCLSHYVTERVTDEQMEQAILEGAYSRGMAGKDC